MIKVAKLTSYLLHPICVALGISLLYFTLQPTYIYKPQLYLMMGVITIVSFILPLILLTVLKGFKMIKSFEIRNIEERRFPTILFICITAMAGNYLLKTTFADLLSLLFLGYTVALIIAYFLLNFKIKVSYHTIALSSAIIFMILFSFSFKLNLLFLIGILFALTGLLLTSRLLLKANTAKEIYISLLISLLSQLGMYAFYFYSI